MAQSPKRRNRPLAGMVTSTLRSAVLLVSVAGTQHRNPASTVAKLFIVAIVGGLLLAALALPTVGGLGLVARKSIDSFNNMPASLADDGKPPQRSVIVASDGESRIANLYLQNRQVVPLSQIPNIAQKALISIEDSRFYKHHGVDPRGILRAVVSDVRRGGASQGASTLTQQYVKQVLLYQTDNANQQQAATADTVARKLKEAHIALDLEKRLSKNDILARYMNIAYYGEGAYGIETAAHTYFGVSAMKLDLAQAALLGGIVQSPYGYDPYRHMDKALARRHEVLVHMQQQHYITKAQMTAADQEKITLTKKSDTPANGCTEAITPSTGFFCDYVRSYLTDVLHLTQTQLYKGGLKIRTTLNTTIQKNAAAAVSKAVPMDNPAAAVMDVVQPGTGRVLAMAVNRKFGNDPKDKTQTSINLATRAVGFGGSTYKAFTLAAALQRQVPFGYEIPTDSSAVAPGLGYTAKNPVKNDSTSEKGTFTLEHAVVQSVNTYFIKLLDGEYFADNMQLPVQDAQRMGMSANSVTAGVAKDVVDNHRGSFTLGAVATSPLDLANAYATIGANGKMCPPNPILSITDSTGKSLPVAAPKCTQAISSKVAIGMSNILKGDTRSDVPYNTTHGAISVGDNHAVAGKTGTANDSAGLFFAGYTPQYAGAVGVFNPAAPSKAMTTIPGYLGDGQNLYGAFAADIWNQALSPVISAEAPSAWPAPDQSIVNGNSVAIPCAVGQNVGDASNYLANLGFNSSPGAAIDSDKPVGTVLSQDPACNTRGQKGGTISLTTSNGKLIKKAPPPKKTTPPKKTKPPKRGGPPRHHVTPG
jgi:membrane peptidoglycan carboxypeptidase